jgi:hypothetical protein
MDYTSISDDGCLTTSGATPYSIGRIFFMRAKIELVSSIPKLHEKTSLKGRVHYNLEHKVVDSCHWLVTNWVLSAKLSGQQEEYLLSTSFVADFLFGDESKRMVKFGLEIVFPVPVNRHCNIVTPRLTFSFSARLRERWKNS